MKDIADLKEYLANKITQLKNQISENQKELDLLTSVMKTVDSLLLQNSFIPAKDLYNQMKEPDVQGSDEKPSPLEEPDKTEFNEDPIKFEDIVLANVKSDENGVKIFLSNDMNMSGEEPPFKSFIMNKIFNELKDEDNHLIKSNQLKENGRFDISIITKNGTNRVEKITTINHRTNKRKEKIIKAISWSLRTIYQGK